MNARRLSPGLLAALGFIASVGPLSVDLYLPAFTDIAADLNAPAASIQLTLTAFLIGISAGQLILGPLSDRLGRRRVLVVALAVFALSSVGMVFVPTVEVLIGLRLIQGLSGAAGIVLARAIAVDLSEGRTAVRALSLIAMVVGLGPIVAPLIGGVASVTWGWRGALAVAAVLAVLMLILAVLVIPESLPPDQRHGAGVLAAMRDFGELLGDRGFRGYLISFSLGFGAMMAYVSASPFVAQTVLGMDPVGYSLAFASSAAALILANIVNARVAPLVGPERMLAVGQIVALAAGLALVILAATSALTIVTFIVAAFVFIAGTGFTMSNASALALAQAPRTLGAGAALIGATQFAVGAAVAPLVGLWGEATALPMAVILVACVLVGGIGALAARSTSH